MWEFLGILATTILVSTLLVGGITRVAKQTEMPGKIAAIEQLRADVRLSNVGSDEAIIGQVAQWNQAIRSNQRYRTIWWGRLFVPKAWETVRLIAINPANEKGE